MADVMAHTGEVIPCPGYKMTEVGEIPEEWEVKRLSDVTMIIMGQSPPSSSYNEVGNGLAFLQGNIDFGSKFPTKRIFCSKPVKVAQAGDVLVTVRAPVGAVNMAQEQYCIGRGVSALRATGVDPDFLYIYLNAASVYWQRIRQGSTFESINRDHLEKLPLPYPPLPEQREIATILSTVDDNIQKTQQIIDKTEELKRGLMQRLLTRGIGHTRFKQTDIGEIPEAWEVARIGDIAQQFISGGTPDTSVAEYWNGDIPWITGVFVTERVVYQGERYITHQGLEDSATHIVPKGGLLLVTRTNVGNIAVAGTDIAISQDLTGIVLDEAQAEPDFIVWYLLQNSQNLTRLQQGTTIQGIVREDVEKVLVALPSLAEQRQIVEMLSTIDEKISRERRQKAHLEQLKKGLMQVLLTGKVRVKTS